MSEEIEIEAEEVDGDDGEAVVDVSRPVIRSVTQSIPVPSIPEDLQDLRHEIVCGKEVTDEDFLEMLDRYANDPKVNLFTIANVIGYHYSAVQKKVNSKRFKDYYTDCKRVRAEMLRQQGRNTLYDALDRIRNGDEEVTMQEVKLVSECARYDMAYATRIDPDTHVRNINGDVNTQINIVTGVETDR